MGSQHFSGYNPSHPSGPTRETFESIVGEKLAFRIPGNIQATQSPLPPINYNVSYTCDMERKPSISSASSTSSARQYTGTPSSSRSASPMDAQDSKATTFKQSPSPSTTLHNSRRQPYPPVSGLSVDTHSCPSCFEQQIDVPVYAGQSCSRCGLSDSGTSIKKGGSRRKVTDRHRFSKAALKSWTGPKPSKSQLESGTRFDQTKAIARQQNQLCGYNANLPWTAAPGIGHEEGGLKLLKGNNKSEDLEKYGNTKPLMYNKLPVLDTHILALKQYHGCLITAEQELVALLDESLSDLQHGLTSEQAATLKSRMFLLVANLKYVREHVGEPNNPPLGLSLSRCSKQKEEDF